jgi:tripartite-type tricarboxylate transporter receptor subunit TctC
MGRILAARMSEILGQVIIENATGAAGIIGVNRVRSTFHIIAWLEGA